MDFNHFFVAGVKLKKKRKKTPQKARRKKSSSVKSLLSRAVSYYQAGDLEQADQLCKKILAINPRHGEALNMRGVILRRDNHQEAALELFQRAVKADPGNPLYYYNCGNACKDLKRFDEAVRCYEQALKLKPDYSEVLNNLGIVFHSQERYDEAVAAYQQALRLKPDFTDVLYNLSTTLLSLDRKREAVLCCRQALDIKPDFPEVYNRLGNMFAEQGNPEAAVQCYQQSLRIRPDDEKCWFDLALLYKKQGRYDQAINCYRKIIDFKPELAVPHNNLGSLLLERGRLKEAEACLRQANTVAPDYAAAHNNLGNLLVDAGRWREAEACYRKALELEPNNASFHSNLGAMLLKDRRLKEAETCLRRAVELDPTHTGAYSNLGTVFIGRGRIEEAEIAFQRAVELDPENHKAYSGLMFALLYHPDKTAAEIFAPFREFDRRFGLPRRQTWHPHTNSRDLNRRLKVGYVSPTFYKHVTRHNLEPLLAYHDRRVVEVYAYHDSAKEDGVTKRYQSYVNHWIPVKGLTDEELAERIRADKIDILVDIAGQTMDNRLLMFALKPAPVSLHWLDFGYTTGLTAIDYFLNDDASAPKGSEEFYAEELWRVETPLYVYRPEVGMGPVSDLPAREKGYITFGSLSRAIRLNYRVIRVWAEILRRVQGSRLIIDNGNFKDEFMQEEIAAKFAAHGIGRGRLEIGYHTPPWDILRRMDITLDCFPTNSATTVFESLYMGVPVVTLARRTGIGRFACPLLKGAGHPEWIATTEDEYIEIVISLVSDLAKLADVRAGLRAEVEASPLMDEPGFARKIEKAYREMFKKWCDARDHEIT